MIGSPIHVMVVLVVHYSYNMNMEVLITSLVILSPIVGGSTATQTLALHCRKCCCSRKCCDINKALAPHCDAIQPTRSGEGGRTGGRVARR